MGSVEKRITRYVAARFGAIPGWSVGYGFDLNEFMDGDDLKRWSDYLNPRLGWFHFVGGRFWVLNRDSLGTKKVVETKKVVHGIKNRPTPLGSTTDQRVLRLKTLQAM